MAVRHVIYPVGEVPHPADVTMILEAASWSGVPGAPEAGSAGRRAAKVQTRSLCARGPAFPCNPELQAARVMVLGIPRPPQHFPGGLIPWWVCQGWKRWESQGSSRHTSSPGSGHVIQRPHKGFPSLADLWSEVTGQELGTLSRSFLSDQPNNLASPVGMSDVSPSIRPFSW